MIVGDWLFLSQFVICVCFDALVKFLEHREAHSQAGVAKKEDAKAEGESPEIEALDPLFVELIRLRDEAERTNSPALFVENSKIRRELLKIEKRWTAIFEAMSADEQRPYLHILGQRGERPPPGECSDPLWGGSLFAKMTNPDLDPTQRTVLVQNFLQKLRAPQKPSGGTDYSRILTAHKLIISWILVHLIVGYSPAISTLPIFSLPVSLTGRLLAGGGLRFPLSLVATKVPLEAAHKYLTGGSWSETAVRSAPTVCREFVSLGWMGTTFIIAAAYSHIKRALRKDGCFYETIKTLF